MIASLSFLGTFYVLFNTTYILGYYTNHYKTEETKKSVAAAVRAAAAPVFSTPKIVAPVFSSAPLYPALSKADSAPAALAAAVSSSSSMAVAATISSSTDSLSSRLSLSLSLPNSLLI